MSTLDASMTDSDERTHLSESEMFTIGDLVVRHQLMPFLSARRLIQLNCPRWSMWDSYNIARISKARTLDDTRDWYFPIIVKVGTAIVKTHLPVYRYSNERTGAFPSFPPFPSLPVNDVWSSWSGIWHSSAQHASERASLLPPMTCLPPEWIHFSIPQDDILASAGGLLLIKSDVIPVRRSKRLNPAPADFNPSSISDPMKLLNGWVGGRTHQSWQRLLVCNPLTRECRELPAADCGWLGLTSWMVVYTKGVQACLVVNEDANCYQVILTFSDGLAVYTSPTNSWNCVRFPRERPWGRNVSPNPYIPEFIRWGYICASAHLGGRLHFADVKRTTAAAASLEPSLRATQAATLRLFEVDGEAGTWQLVRMYTLRKFHIPSLKFHVNTFFYDMSIIPYLEILESTAGWYAVLPAKIHDAWLINEEDENFIDWKSRSLFGVDERGTDFLFMPLCFYIMQLDGPGFGVLRIQVPLTNEIDYVSRGRRFMSIAEDFSVRNWFSCEVRDKVIWVTCEDYLLSFDVVSGESHTRIIPVDEGSNHQFREETLRFAYRPSLHMKP